MVPRRARIQCPKTFVSLNSGLEGNNGEEEYPKLAASEREDVAAPMEQVRTMNSDLQFRNGRHTPNPTPLTQPLTPEARHPKLSSLISSP